MKLKKAFKKAIAAIEVVAMTLALVGGLSLANIVDVSAASGTLTLNAGTEIVSDSEEVYSFTAPASGIYYFYSVTTDDYDPYADLITETDELYSDDERNLDFWLEAELSDGEECELIVSSYEAEDGQEYETIVYVLDEETAKKTLYQITDEGSLYITPGEAYEITLNIESVSKDAITEIPEGYSVKWYEGNDYDYYSEETELNETGLSFSFAEVTDDNLCTEAADYRYYAAKIYKGDVLIDDAKFYLYDIEKSVYVSGDTYYANVGDELTLMPIVYDYEDEEINLEEKDNYTYKWYKATEDEYGDYEDYNIISGATDYSYTVDVADGDFCTESNNYTSYVCEVYIDGELIDSASFTIYDVNKYIYVLGHSYSVSEGDDVTLVPTIYDYDDNEMDINDDDFQFTWYTYDEDYNEIEVGNTPTLTVKDVSFDDEELYYYVEIVYKGDTYEYADFTIYNAYITFYGGDDELAAEIGDNLTLEVQLYDYNDELFTEFDESFSFEWRKATYDEAGDEEVYGEVLGTAKTYEIESVEESDIYCEDTDYTYYACQVYRDDVYVATHNVYIHDKETYWEVKTSSDIYASVGDTVTFKPTIVDGDGQEIDIDSGRFSFEWYDNNDDYIGSNSSYTIDSVTEDNFDYAGEYGYYSVYIYDELSDSSSLAEFYLYNKGKGEEPSTEPPTEPPTDTPPTESLTTVAPTTPTTEEVTAPAKAKVKKVKAKKKAAKKIKLTLKKIKSAVGYQVAVYKTKKNAKKNKKVIVKKFTKKVKITLKSKKLKNKKKLFVKARAYVLDAKGNKVYGKWSKVKKVKIK